MNCVILTGRLSKDISLSDSGKTATTSFAVNRPYPFSKDKDGKEVTDFLNLKFIGEKSVNHATQYLHKGVKICLRGIICHDSWKDNNDEWQHFNYIIVQEWEFAESKSVSQQNGQAPATQQMPTANDFMSISETNDDIPF